MGGLSNNITRVIISIPFFFGCTVWHVVVVVSRSVVSDSATPRTVAHQDSMGILQATILEWVAMPFSLCGTLDLVSLTRD